MKIVPKCKNMGVYKMNIINTIKISINDLNNHYSYINDNDVDYDIVDTNMEPETFRGLELFNISIDENMVTINSLIDELEYMSYVFEYAFALHEFIYGTIEKNTFDERYDEFINHTKLVKNKCKNDDVYCKFLQFTDDLIFKTITEYIEKLNGDDSYYNYGQSWVIEIVEVIIDYLNKYKMT